MLTTNNGSENLVIGDYTPKSQSEESVNSHNILSNLRSKMNYPAKESQKDIKQLVKMMKKNDSVKNEITQELKATVPKNIVKDSVGEVLYSCIRSQTNGKFSSCTPECVTGPPLSGKSGCNVPVYLKTSSNFIKLNNVIGSDADVYTSDAFASLTPSEESKLRDDGVTDVNVYEKEQGSTRYRNVSRSSLSSDSQTRSDSDSSSSHKSVSWSEDTKDNKKKSKNTESSHYTYESSSGECEPSGKSCSTGSNWGLIAAVVVVVLIVLLIVVAFWWFGSSTTTSTPSEKVSVTTTKTSYVAQEPLSWA